MQLKKGKSESLLRDKQQKIKSKGTNNYTQALVWSKVCTCRHATVCVTSPPLLPWVNGRGSSTDRVRFRVSADSLWPEKTCTSAPGLEVTLELGHLWCLLSRSHTLSSNTNFICTNWKKQTNNWFHLKTRDLFGIKPLWSFTLKHGYVTILTDKSRMWDYWDLENIVLNGIIMLMNEFLWWQHLLCLIYLLRFPFNVVNIHNMT